MLQKNILTSISFSSHCGTCDYSSRAIAHAADMVNVLAHIFDSRTRKAIDFAPSHDSPCLAFVRAAVMCDASLN